MTDDEIESLWQRARGKQAPAGCDQCGRIEARRWPDTIPTGHGSEAMKYKKPIRCRPLSLASRLYLAFIRFFRG